MSRLRLSRAEGAEMEAKIITKLAENKTPKTIAKELGVKKDLVNKRINRDPDLKEKAKKLKETLVEYHLDIAKEAAEILKKNNFEKLQNEKAMSLSIISKMMGESAQNLSGGANALNIGSLNVQMLVEKVSKAAELDRRKVSKGNRNEDGEVIDVEPEKKEKDL